MAHQHLVVEGHNMRPLTWARGQVRVVMTCSCGLEVASYRPEVHGVLERALDAWHEHLMNEKLAAELIAELGYLPAESQPKIGPKIAPPFSVTPLHPGEPSFDQ